MQNSKNLPAHPTIQLHCLYMMIVMKSVRWMLFTLLLAFSSVANSATAYSSVISPRTVVVPSGTLRLKAFLWTPTGPGPFPAVLFNHGSGEGDPQHTGKLVITAAAKKIAPVLLKHGYAFLYLFRRGHGLSADQGPFIQDLLKREAAANGDLARKQLQLRLLTTDHLDDVRAGVSFLRSLPEIDGQRIAVVGHSFGGQLTLLAAERDDKVRAVITFGAAAASWQSSSELRELLMKAVRKINAPIMLIYSANDYSLEPGESMAAVLSRRAKPYVLKILPAVGRTTDDGHMAVYTAIGLWEQSVFEFLDRSMSAPQAMHGAVYSGESSKSFCHTNQLLRKVTTSLPDR
jgi:carboxymethylenebutenolidase